MADWETDRTGRCGGRSVLRVFDAVVFTVISVLMSLEARGRTGDRVAGDTSESVTLLDVTVKPEDWDEKREHGDSCGHTATPSTVL